MKKNIGRDYVGFIRRKPFFLCVGIVGAVSIFFALPFFFRTTYISLPALPSADDLLSAVAVEQVSHLSTPEPLKAIYMTSCVAGSLSLRDSLVKLINESELNAIVIDIKDYSGYISFFPKNEGLADFVSPRCAVKDMREFVEELHSHGIYVIGRITVFQDPLFAKLHPEFAVKKKSDKSIWHDFKGLSFTDPGSKDVWEHIVAIAKESYAIGFDELNFDYIRFPSDGPMSDIAFDWSGNRAKSDVLESFFSFLASELKPIGAVISADLFGMTTTNTDDLNIGQVLEKAEPYFDYISPMVYPSHYPANFNGYGNPNKYPYEVVKYSMDEAVKRFLATTTKVALRGAEPISTSTKPFLYPKNAWNKLKLRPWLQDFDYGGDYDVKEVRAQIQAVYDAGLTSWMLWAPSNRYTVGALDSIAPQ